jgi:hypothetical protein
MPQKLPCFNFNYLDVLDHPNKFYFLGMWFADGNCDNIGRASCLSLQESDKAVIDKLCEWIEHKGNLQYLDGTKKNKKKWLQTSFSF